MLSQWQTTQDLFQICQVAIIFTLVTVYGNIGMCLAWSRGLSKIFYGMFRSFLVRAVTTLLLASKLIFCWKLISLDVDFIFGALRREGKNGPLIAFCSGTSLCDLGLQTCLVSALQGVCWLGHLKIQWFHAEIMLCAILVSLNIE